MTELRPKLGARLCERALEIILEENREKACDRDHKQASIALFYRHDLRSLGPIGLGRFIRFRDDFFEHL